MMHSLESNDVHVWVFFTTVSEEERRGYHAILSREERARADRLVFEADRIRFVASHGLMRVKLGEYCDVRPENLEFAAGVHGKPYLLDPATPLQFNLSHSGSLALLAVTSQRRCGIDVEIMRTKIDNEAIAERFFNVREKESLRSLPALQRRREFFRLWAVKEAILKAAGKGLSQPLSSIDTTNVIRGTSPNITVPDGNRPIRAFWVRELTVEDGYASALAIETADADSPQVQIFRR